ncbi:MAG: hypothetical protein M3P18_24630 [Actinomycetota bacterium]|nr:hypothetical protein [Actinomycetota bacterium]
MTTVMLVGGDLMAKSRIVDATSKAGVTFESTTVNDFSEHLRTIRPSVVVIDLDEGRDAVLQELRAARAEGLLPSRTVGYYSHVDRTLGEAATEAGCDAWPRGKFWGNLQQLLQPDH